MGDFNPGITLNAISSRVYINYTAVYNYSPATLRFYTISIS